MQAPTHLSTLTHIHAMHTPLHIRSHQFTPLHTLPHTYVHPQPAQTKIHTHAWLRNNLYKLISKEATYKTGKIEKGRNKSGLKVFSRLKTSLRLKMLKIAFRSWKLSKNSNIFLLIIFKWFPLNNKCKFHYLYHSFFMRFSLFRCRNPHSVP